MWNEFSKGKEFNKGNERQYWWESKWNNWLTKLLWQIVPENYIVRIQYNSSNNVDLFVYETVRDSRERENLFGQWDVNIDDYKETSQTDYEKEYGGKTKSLEVVKSKLNWTRDTFSKLYDKLEKANCIGICNKRPVEIEYGFSGMALLSFMVFDKNLTVEQQKEYSDDCMSMFYKENIVLNYVSGATGSLCSPEFKKKNEAGR